MRAPLEGVIMGPIIHVIAGAPGAGKTSLGGAMRHLQGLDYFDPETFARWVHEDGEQDLRRCLELGWRESVRRLGRAIAQQRYYGFETTLAGKTIPALLALAAQRGMRVQVWYFGLESPDLLVYRAQRRALHGGWPRDDAEIRSAWHRSLCGLLDLLPYVDALNLYDNSAARAPAAPTVPEPRELMTFGPGVASRTISDKASIPDWAKPVFEAALALEMRPRCAA